MKTKYKILAIIAPVIFVSDQITKLAIEHLMRLGERVPVIPSFFDIVHFQNKGAAFGMFSGVSDALRVPFFYVIAAVAAILILVFYRSVADDERMIPVAFSLIVGGIAGNIVDRLRLGAVTDFLSFHIGDEILRFAAFGRAFAIPLEWPAFNVADSAISIAMVLIVISAFKNKK